MINPLNVAALLALAGGLACVFSLICGSPRFLRKVAHMLEILNAIVNRLIAAHDRIGGLKSERDAALARVAELEAALARVGDLGVIEEALSAVDRKVAEVEGALA